MLHVLFIQNVTLATHHLTEINVKAIHLGLSPMLNDIKYNFSLRQYQATGALNNNPVLKEGDIVTIKYIEEYKPDYIINLL